MDRPKLKREEYYTACKKHRGEAATKRLIMEVNREWRMQNGHG